MPHDALPLDPGESILMVKNKGDHSLIVTTKRLFTWKDGKVSPVTLPEEYVQ